MLRQNMVVTSSHQYLRRAPCAHADVLQQHFETGVAMDADVYFYVRQRQVGAGLLWGRRVPAQPCTLAP